MDAETIFGRLLAFVREAKEILGKDSVTVEIVIATQGEDLEEDP